MASIRRELLDAVRPGDVAAYVRARGWKQVRELQGRVSWWTPPAGTASEIELMLPLARTLGDYYPRLSDAVAALAEHEQRSPDQVVAGIRARFEDIVRVRLKRPDAADGTMPLHRGAEAISRVADLFEAAASAAVRVAPVFQRTPEAARKFLTDARLGQTEVGSYVITVHSRLDDQTDWIVDEARVPFQRQVIITLASALSAAKMAVTAQDRPAAFRKSVRSGVSANLCRALFSLGIGEELAAVEFNVSWASAEPAPPDVPREVAFTQLAFPVLRDAAKYLAKIDPEAQFLMVGLVRRLQKDDPTLFEEPGSVWIFGDVHGENRLVNVKLSPDDYVQAIHAHEQGRVVRVVGTLRQDGDRFRLEDPTHFAIR